MTISIVSTQIRDNVFVLYTWLDFQRVEYKGDYLVVTTASGYVAVYSRREFITFDIF